MKAEAGGDGGFLNLRRTVMEKLRKDALLTRQLLQIYGDEAAMPERAERARKGFILKPRKLWLRLVTSEGCLQDRVRER